MISLKSRERTGEEGPDGDDGAEVGVGGHVDGGNVARANAEECQCRREQHVPHRQRYRVGEAVVGQNPLVVHDYRAGEGDPQRHVQCVEHHLHQHTWSLQSQEVAMQLCHCRSRFLCLLVVPWQP